MPKKKQEVLVFPEYWQRYGDLDSVVEVAARRAWTFGILQTQRIYLPVVQENEKLKAEIKELKDECRRTKRALDGACESCKLELTPSCPIRTGKGCDLYQPRQ